MKDRLFNFLGFTIAGSNVILGFTINEVAAIVTFIISMLFFAWKYKKEKALSHAAKLAEEEAELKLKIRQYEYQKKVESSMGEDNRNQRTKV